MQVFADDGANQPPELILGMGVILGGGERGVSWQAAENENPRIGPRNGREAGLHSTCPEALQICVCGFHH